MQAVERAESEGRDWAIKHENLMQARADEQTIREILKKAYAYQQVSTPDTNDKILGHLLAVYSISWPQCMGDPRQAATNAQAKVAAAMAVAEANARRAEDIQAAAEAAQERFAQVRTLPSPHLVLPLVALQSVAIAARSYS